MSSKNVTSDVVSVDEQAFEKHDESEVDEDGFEVVDETPEFRATVQMEVQAKVDSNHPDARVSYVDAPEVVTRLVMTGLLGPSFMLFDRLFDAINPPEGPPPMIDSHGQENEKAGIILPLLGSKLLYSTVDGELVSGPRALT